ncbi:hypothetical protein QMU91_002390 [Flavobacterium psychrophilum]|nr:hypothetical protein [Flavobacterium psychrophilum]
MKKTLILLLIFTLTSCSKKDDIPDAVTNPITLNYTEWNSSVYNTDPFLHKQYYLRYVGIENNTTNTIMECQKQQNFYIRYEQYRTGEFHKVDICDGYADYGSVLFNWGSTYFEMKYDDISYQYIPTFTSDYKYLKIILNAKYIFYPSSNNIQSSLTYPINTRKVYIYERMN